MPFDFTKMLLYLILNLSFVLGNSFLLKANSSFSCGDWVAFQNEKCIKIFDELKSYEDAKRTCISQEVGEPTMIMIKSHEEQKFIEYLLFNQSQIVEPVWLGAKRDNKTKNFVWEDGTDDITIYSNWGTLKNGSNDDCVEITPEGQFQGKWVDVPCKKRNIFICQRVPNARISELKKELNDLKKEMQKKLDNFKKETNKTVGDLKKQVDDLKKESNDLKNNPIPIGFIYVQLPNQSLPSAIWSNVEWEEVTSQYANLFFRVAGDKSAKFNGGIQEESSPKLVRVHSGHSANYSHDYIYPEPGLESFGIFSGDNVFPQSRVAEYYLNFLVSNDEVRPGNAAIKIWKRIK